MMANKVAPIRRGSLLNDRKAITTVQPCSHTSLPVDFPLTYMSFPRVGNRRGVLQSFDSPTLVRIAEPRQGMFDQCSRRISRDCASTESSFLALIGAEL
jgi:hypothetical protein